VDYVRLGCSGLKVSRIGLGMMSYGDPTAQFWALGEDQAEPIVRRAVEAGVTFFDTADVYSDGASEVIAGRLLTRLFARREDYVLATKVPSTSTSTTFTDSIPRPLSRCSRTWSVMAGLSSLRSAPEGLRARA
jgi:aryl-alcohol dehydrogenase-like predicted oxidoreductase